MNKHSKAKMYINKGVCLAVAIAIVVFCSRSAFGQEQRSLTLSESIAIALDQSYDAKRLEQSLISSQKSLRAAQADFKSNGQLIFSRFPDFQENERQTPLPGGSFVFDRQRFLDFQLQLFVNQPLAMTDGTFSLVGSMQRFQQFGEFEETFLGPDGVMTTTIQDPADYSPNLRLQYRQPLFTLNRLKTGLKRAELNLENTTQTYLRSQLDLVFGVTTSFYDLFKAQQQLEIDREKVKQSEEAYRLSRLKQQAGLLPEVEVLRLEVELANAQNTLSASQASLRQLEDAFKLLIGIPLEEKMQVEAELTYEPVEISLEKAMREALNRRTELRSDEINIALDELSVKETDALSQIEGELFMSYGIFNRRDNFSDAFQDFNQDRRVNLSLTVPLWDWGKNAAQVQAAQATLENSRLAKRNRVDQIKREIRNAIRSFESARERVEITRRSEELARKSYRISLLRFENGDLSTQDLALEQNRLTQARTNSLTAVIDYKQALADVRRKTLWDFEANRPITDEILE